MDIEAICSWAADTLEQRNSYQSLQYIATLPESLFENCEEKDHRGSGMTGKIWIGRSV